MKKEMETQKIIITGGATRNGAAIAEDLANGKNQITIHYNKSKIWITAIRNIKKNEELSYDYGFSFDCNYKDHICKCGSKNCVGFIVREGSRWRLKKFDISCH